LGLRFEMGANGGSGVERLRVTSINKRGPSSKAGQYFTDYWIELRGTSRAEVVGEALKRPSSFFSR